VRPLFSVFFLFYSLLFGQNQQAALNKIITGLSHRAESGKSISFEGEVTIEGQSGDNPGRLLSKARIRYAIAPGGKSLLHLKPEDKDEYMLVSDGEKDWAYVPRLKQYTEATGVRLESASSEEEEQDSVSDAGSGPDSDSERDLAERFARLVHPTLASCVKTASAADVSDPVEVRYEGKKDKWPVVRILSKELPGAWRRMTELAIDPATGRLGRLVMADVSRTEGRRDVVRSTFLFTRFSIGESLPDSTFAFTPPGNAKLVESVPIPGETGSYLLNKPAPDFEAKTLDGRVVRLSELRGTAVLLNFWASWCGPCRRELPVLADVYDKYKNNGLLILGVNDEGKSIAKGYQKDIGLNFETLDDSNLKLHKAFRVRSIPTIFLIDKDGKVIRFARGARDAAELKTLIQSAGL
jgi:thiol-disulfide isomerase/thioredoxin